MILRRTATTAPGPWTTEPGTMPGSISVLDATGARVCLVLDRPRIAEFIARHGPAEGEDVDAWRNRIAFAAMEADLAIPVAANSARPGRAAGDPRQDGSLWLSVRRWLGRSPAQRRTPAI